MTVADLAARVPVAAITAKARELRFWPMVLQLVAGLLFAVGWLAYKAVAAVWFVVAWAVAAIAVGWSTARHPPEPTAVDA